MTNIFQKPVTRIYIYPFLLANIIVLILAFLFQHMMQLPLLFSLSSGVVYICMFWVMIKRYRLITGKKISKRSLVLVFILVAFLFISLIAEAVMSYPTKAPLYRISRKNDPSSMKLEENEYCSYLKDTFLIEEEVQLGIIQMKDGSSSKYWFKGHHSTNDIGGTWFEMSDGKKMYMAGYFCCGVDFPEKQFENLTELSGFIKKHHGTKP